MSTRRTTTKVKDASQEIKGKKSISPTHYPFVFAKVKKSFIEIIQGMQPIKERELDLGSFGIDKGVKVIIGCQGWDEFCKKLDEGVW